MLRKYAAKQAWGGASQLLFLMGLFQVQYCLISVLTTLTVRWTVLFACFRMKVNSSDWSTH